jgi:hypothetical protein
MPRCISPRYCQSWRAIIIVCRALHTRRLTAPSDPGPAHTPLPGRLPDKHWRQTMKTPIALALFAILAFATSPAGAAERACRPSLSNFYHCPDTSAPATKTTTKTTKTASPSGRACRPSLSNLWTCPGTSQPSQKSREDQGSAPPRKTASTPERGCRPSLSNGYKCPGEGQAGANNIRRKRWRGRIAPPTRSSGQIPGRTSTTSGETTITATRKPGPICVSRNRLLRGCAQRKMKSILEEAPQSSRSSTVHLTRQLYFVRQGLPQIGN